MTLLIFIGFVALLFGFCITMWRLVAPGEVHGSRMIVGGVSHFVVAVCAAVLLGFGAGNTSLLVGLIVCEIVFGVAFFIGHICDIETKEAKVVSPTAS